jgi:hypothetical protein
VGIDRNDPPEPEYPGRVIGVDSPFSTSFFFLSRESRPKKFHIFTVRLGLPNSASFLFTDLVPTDRYASAVKVLDWWNHCAVLNFKKFSYQDTTGDGL